MKNLIIVNKKEGETPLQALESLRARNKSYKDLKMTYAGRLDPMASGLLILLAGEENKNKEKYLKLGKEYEFQVLFGFATDTYDLLGKVLSSKVLTNIGMKKSDKLKSLIKQNLKHFTGKFMQKYPMYSSKTVDGKQLFTYARAGRKVKVPEHEVSVTSLKFLKLKTINSQKLLENIKGRIKKVQGDFRQKEILKIWQEKLAAKNRDIFYVADFKTKCSSGTYVRGIANSLGSLLGIPALAFSIKRTKIGKWSSSQKNTKS